MDRLDIPGDRDFPAGHLKARRDHLVREARASTGPHRHGLWFLRFTPRSATRIVVFAAVLIAIAIGGLAIDRTTSGHKEFASAAVKVNLSSGGSSKEVTINVLSAMNARAQNNNVEIAGGTSEQQDLLRTILSRMPDNSLTRVSVAPETRMGETGVGLAIEALPGDFPRSDWEKMLVASAFRALSADRGLPPVVGLPSPQAGYSPTSETATEVEAKIRAAAGAAGAEVVQLQIYQPDGIAPAVILKVDDPGAFLKDRARAFLDASGNQSLNYEGMFIGVVDSNGAFVWETARNLLAMEGSVGTRPDLLGCSPIINLDTVPGPCPTS
jgi:hypothetical protein